MSKILPPRVSILIPNYNNGAQSSRTGTEDLIGHLLESLEQTLTGEKTPFEIIVYDDGSSDDSLETLRKWSGKTWADGSPFLELIEDEHCGVLARTANIMSRRAQGDILARLDGDVVCLTKHWVSKLVRFFDQGDDKLGVVGPKQLKPSGRIHAYGDFVLHPHGYIHVASNLPRNSVTKPLEVDHVMGCFYCCKKTVFDDIDGYDENFLRGQTIDFGLRARKAGWRCFAIPQIEYVHNHTKRENRATTADSDAGVTQTLDVFKEKWGFHRLAADMAVVAEQYIDSPLLWNKLYFGDDAWQPPPTDPIDLAASEWSRYAADEIYQKKIHLRVVATFDVMKQTPHVSGEPRTLAILGGSHGIVTHLLANQGCPCIAFDEREACVSFSQKCVLNQAYPNQKPQFNHMADVQKIDLPDNSVDQVLIDRMLERHPNPVALLHEAQRILKPNHFVVIVSDRTSQEGLDPSDPATFKRLMTSQRQYQWMELVNQVTASGLGIAMDIFKDDKSRDMVLIAQKMLVTPPELSTK